MIAVETGVEETASVGYVLLQLGLRFLAGLEHVGYAVFRPFYGVEIAAADKI